jgi:hypothetical protein
MLDGTGEGEVPLAPARRLRGDGSGRCVLAAPVGVMRGARLRPAIVCVCVCVCVCVWVGG